MAFLQHLFTCVLNSFSSLAGLILFFEQPMTGPIWGFTKIVKINGWVPLHLSKLGYIFIEYSTIEYFCVFFSSPFFMPERFWEHCDPNLGVMSGKSKHYLCIFPLMKCIDGQLYSTHLKTEGFWVGFLWCAGFFSSSIPISVSLTKSLK